MANVRIDLKNELVNGQSVVFEAPCDCTEVTGLVAYYHNGEDIVSESFSFKDAHGNNLANIGNLFTQGAYVKAVLDTTKKAAYIQNADTNSYLEGRFDELNSDLSELKPIFTTKAYTLETINFAAGEVNGWTKNVALDGYYPISFGVQVGSVFMNINELYMNGSSIVLNLQNRSIEAESVTPKLYVRYLKRTLT